MWTGGKLALAGAPPVPLGWKHSRVGIRRENRRETASVALSPRGLPELRQARLNSNAAESPFGGFYLLTPKLFFQRKPSECSVSEQEIPLA